MDKCWKYWTHVPYLSHLILANFGLVESTFRMPMFVHPPIYVQLSHLRLFKTRLPLCPHERVGTALVLTTRNWGAESCKGNARQTHKAHMPKRPTCVWLMLVFTSPSQLLYAHRPLPIHLWFLIMYRTYSKWTNYSNPASMSCRITPVPPNFNVMVPYICSWS